MQAGTKATRQNSPSATIKTSISIAMSLCRAERPGG